MASRRLGGGALLYWRSMSPPLGLELHHAYRPTAATPPADVWASMGQKDEADYRRQRFKGFQVGCA